MEHEEIDQDIYPLPKKPAKGKAAVKILVKDKAKVNSADILFVNEAGEKVAVKNSGTVKIENDKVIVVAKIKKLETYKVPSEFNLLVKDGDLVSRGDSLTDGSLDLKQLYRLKGKAATQRYIVDEIQTIYASQGQKLNDRHVELIARQMFSRALVTEPGDTEFLVGERLDIQELEKINSEIKKKGGQLAQYEILLLGITKVSLSTSSFLSAASFQETSRVLINAAVAGRIDRLSGLKENVIIGRLIPAGTGFEKAEKARAQG